MTCDMLCTVAQGALYAGRTTMAGPVIYLTCEGVSGFKRRLVAMRQHRGIEGHGVPFFMIENVPDLGSEATDLPQLLAELDAFIAARCQERPRAVVLDTLARCMGEGDENSARDMGRFVHRCGIIERHLGCVVVVVHHVEGSVSGRTWLECAERRRRRDDAGPEGRDAQHRHRRRNEGWTRGPGVAVPAPIIQSKRNRRAWLR